MSLIVIVIIAAAMYAGGFATGWKVDTWKHGAEQAAELKAAQTAADEARAERDLIANRFETKLANLRIVNRTINNEVRHEVEKTVYGDPNCNLPDSGRKLRDAAIDAANGNPGEPAPAVPADPKATSGQAGFLGRLVPGRFGSDQPVR